MYITFKQFLVKQEDGTIPRLSLPPFVEDPAVRYVKTTKTVQEDHVDFSGVPVDPPMRCNGGCAKSVDVKADNGGSAAGVEVKAEGQAVVKAEGQAVVKAEGQAVVKAEGQAVVKAVVKAEAQAVVKAARASSPAGVGVVAENGAAAGVALMVPAAAPMVPAAAPAAAGRGAPRPRWQPKPGPRRSVRLQDERGKRRAHRTN